ncbi:MAG TPA: SDR family oxidoreductase [Anaerolineae bacterium]|nr:SDR family oxidoreductase [Anaerolineae bacterium]
MNVLVTGASGYLGGALLRYLDANHPGWDVHATFFSIPPADGYPNAHSLDLRDPHSVERVLAAAQPDLIFHTAALNEGDAQEMYETNARGSEYLAKGAAKQGARLIHLSSDVIFDGTRGNYSEDDTPNPITPYAVSKADAEKAVLASGADAVLVRTSLIYGFKPLDRRTRSILLGEMPRLYTDEMRCPIWVNNLCEALVEVGEMDYRGVLHVAGTQPLSRYDFGMKLMEAMNGDPGQLIPARSSENSLVRPLDCTLNVSRAQRILKTKLMSVDEVLARRGSS